MTASDHKEVPKTCGMTELLIFIAAIVSGTACSICSKTMMDLHGIGITGEVESFSKPLFQTFGMFVGMLFGLLMHWAVVFFRIPFPGYDHPSKVTNVTTNARANETPAKNHMGAGVGRGAGKCGGTGVRVWSVAGGVPLDSPFTGAGPRRRGQARSDRLRNRADR